MVDQPAYSVEISKETRLVKCERIIENGLQTFIETGNALLEIRDSRLYLEKFATFEEYCRVRWGMVSSRARQLIMAAEVVQNIESVTMVTLPDSERAVRPLTRLEPALQRAAWNEVVESELPITAKLVEEKVKEVEELNPIVSQLSTPISKAIYAFENEKQLLDKAREIRDEQNKQRKEQQQILRDSKTELPAPSGFYDLIYIDPPWRYEHSISSSRDIENQYPTMTLEEMKEMSIPAADNCVLLMWVTAPKVAESVELLNAWGFTYRTCAVWDKEIIGMGYWFRSQHELLFVAVKGQVSPPEVEHRISSVYREKRGQHSSKPHFYYDFIEKSFPGLSKIEVFARNKREGWEAWGNENI